MTRATVFPGLLVLLAAVVASPAAAVERPFNGKDLSGWTTKQPASRSHWAIGTATLDLAAPTQLDFKEKGHQLVNASEHGVDIYTNAKYGDVVIELDVMVPKQSNSGIYVMGEYEVQVLDSYGKKTVGQGDMGAIYGVAAPRVNACKAPGEWQTYRIDFRAPRFDSQGKKIANARFVQVVLNGQVILENLEMHDHCPGDLAGKEVPRGPLLFQGNHGAVAFRNIRITPRTPGR